MLFNSFQFLFFFPVVAGVYYLIPHRYRWAFLLAGSYFFYMCWRVEYLGLILLSTAVDFYAGQKMAAIPERSGRRKYLYLSLLTNLGLLFAFKYYYFFASNTNYALEWLGFGFEFPLMDILLPVGISFYTFQTLSYTIDVYRGNQEPARHFGKFALFVSFFPSVGGGPGGKGIETAASIRYDQKLRLCPRQGWA